MQGYYGASQKGGSSGGMEPLSFNFLAWDPRSEHSFVESTESVRERYGSLNLLINAAGILSIPGVLQSEYKKKKILRRQKCFNILRSCQLSILNCLSLLDLRGQRYTCTITKRAFHH